VTTERHFSNPKLQFSPATSPRSCARRRTDGEREIVNLNWGFVLLQKDRAPKRVTNVRDDKILTSKV
jgi:putative SOS response-associated peptidase YedK